MAELLQSDLIGVSNYICRSQANPDAGAGLLAGALLSQTANAVPAKLPAASKPVKYAATRANGLRAGGGVFSRMPMARDQAALRPLSGHASHLVVSIRLF
jgi:hypothetical protein